MDINSLPIIDCHTHVYPAKIAAKASKAINAFYEDDHLDSSESSDQIRKEFIRIMQGFIDSMHTERFAYPDIKGTIEGALVECAGTPIKYHLIYSVATTPAQVTSINNYIAQTCEQHPSCIGFAAMHQDFENPAAELDRVQALGLRGIKLHPDFQQVNIDDPRLEPLYEAAQKRNMPITIHTGDYRYDCSNPKRLVNVLKAFPGLVVDAAHMGGWSCTDQWLGDLSEKNLGKSTAKRCFVDTSSSTRVLTRAQMKAAIENYGIERVMYGSDYPMWNPAEELKRFMALGLSDKEIDAICTRNAEVYLQMTFH